MTGAFGTTIALDSGNEESYTRLSKQKLFLLVLVAVSLGVPATARGTATRWTDRSSRTPGLRFTPDAWILS